MFKSLFGLVEDAVEITKAPVKVAANLARIVTKPAADAAKFVADGVEEVTKQDGDR